MSEDELVYQRVFRAPRELVWRCLTEPAELAQFWGPRGMTTPVDHIVVELRPGGRFETLMTGEHGNHRMVASFTEVVPPERLAWVEPATGMHTTSTLDDLGEADLRRRDLPVLRKAAAVLGLSALPMAYATAMPPARTVTPSRSCTSSRESVLAYFCALFSPPFRFATIRPDSLSLLTSRAAACGGDVHADDKSRTHGDRFR